MTAVLKYIIPIICVECVHHVPLRSMAKSINIDECASNPVGMNYVTGKLILRQCAMKNLTGECEEFTPKAGAR